MEIFRVNTKKARFIKNGTPYTLYLSTTEIMYMPKSVTSGDSLVGTDGVIMGTGTEIKNATISIPVLNAVENIRVAEILSADPSFDSMEFEATKTNGLPVIIKARDIIRKGRFQFDIGVGGGETNTVEFDCGSVNFV